MAEQAIEDGTILTTKNGVELQLTGVRYTEDPATQERSNQEYVFRTVADLEQEKRLAEEEAARAAEDTENAAQINEAFAESEKTEAQSENSPEGSAEKTTQENSLPVN